MAESNDPFLQQLKWGLKNSPSRSGGGFFDIMYALGMPMWSKANGGFQMYQVGQDMRMDQLKRGQMQPPAQAAAAAAPRDPATDKLTPWYVDWLKSSGVRGLL